MHDSRWIIPGLVLICLTGTLSAQSQPEEDFTAIRMAWEAGDYPTALRGFERILSGQAGSTFRERIAQITGETFVTKELTADGRAVRFSPTGEWIGYERGPTAAAWTIIVRASTMQVVDSLLGTAAAFDDTHDRVAVLRSVAGRPSRLVLRDLDPSRERVVADSMLWVAPLAFGQAGRRCTWIEAPGQRAQVVRRRPG